jgi:hypothetical protein
MPDRNDYPTQPVTVTIGSDGHVQSVHPHDLTCTGPTYIKWTFVGAALPKHGVIKNLPTSVFVPQPTPPDPQTITVEVLNLCTLPGQNYPYKAGLDGGPLIDPSIDNVPTTEG